MADKLSQSDIDDLLSALSAGEVDVAEIEDKNAKKVKPYDFRRPDKFAKEQLRTLEIIHENLARMMTSFLSGYLRCSVEADVISTESMIYSEFNNSISNPSIIGLINFEPLDGQIIMEIGSDLAFSIIDRLLGGLGKNPIPKEKRAITEIEEILVRSILNKTCQMMKESWANIIELNPKLGNIETNSQFTQLFSPSESIALITYQIKLDDSEGLINVAIPHIVIEPILPNLSSKFWFTGSNKKEGLDEDKEMISSVLKKSKIELRTEIGSTVISVKELLGLGLGDVIMFGTKAKEALEVYVEDELKYKAYPGKVGSKLAIKISEKIGTLSKEKLEKTSNLDNPESREIESYEKQNYYDESQEEETSEYNQEANYNQDQEEIAEDYNIETEEGGMWFGRYVISRGNQRSFRGWKLRWPSWWKFRKKRRNRRSASSWRWRGRELWSRKRRKKRAKLSSNFIRLRKRYPRRNRKYKHGYSGDNAIYSA